MGRTWNYTKNGEVLGPFSQEKLGSLIASGFLTQDDLVWSEGLADWTAIRLVPEFAQAQVPAPAPIPQAGGFRPSPRPAIELSEPEPFASPKAVLPAAAPVIRTTEPTVPLGAIEMLQRTKPWVRLVAILGFLGLGLMLILLMVLMGGVGPFGLMRESQRGVLAFFYLVTMGIQVPPVLFLNAYATRIGTLVDSGRPEDLEDALRAQKSFWLYVGILAVIVMGIYLLAILAAIALPALLGARHP